MLVLTPDFTIVSVPVGGCKRVEKGIKNISIPKDTTSRQVFIDTVTFWAVLKTTLIAGTEAGH